MKGEAERMSCRLSPAPILFHLVPSLWDGDSGRFTTSIITSGNALEDTPRDAFNWARWCVLTKVTVKTYLYRPFLPEVSGGCKQQDVEVTSDQAQALAAEA